MELGGGCSKEKKQLAEDDIIRLEADLQLHWSSSLVYQLQTAQASLSTFFNQEESILQEKARSTWLSAGDRNSALFHASIKDRQSKQASFKLLLDDSTYSTDQGKIGSAAVTYFSSMFSAGSFDFSSFLLD